MQNIWQENFDDLATGTTIDQSDTSWSIDKPETNNSIFEVRDGAFYSSDTDGIAVWQSEVIDISTFSDVNLSLDIWGQGNLDNYGEIADFIEVFYFLDGQEVVLARRDGKFNSGNLDNLTTEGLNGETLQIGIRTQTTGDDEAYLWDNLLVTGNSAFVTSDTTEEVLFSTANLITYESFNDNQFEDFKYEQPREDSVQSSTLYDRDGSGQSLQVNLKKDDPDVHGSKRAELRLDADIGEFEIGEEAWIGFSVFVPEDYQDDDSFEIIFQMHSYPDSHLGEEWRSPPMHLRIKAGELLIQHQHDTKALTLNNNPEAKFEYSLGALPKGVWTDLALYIDYQLDETGQINVYQNGEQVYAYTGVVGYNDEGGMFTKLGLYKPDWKYNPDRSTTTERTLYFDAFRFARGEAGLADVDPATIYSDETTGTEPSPLLMGRKYSLRETLPFNLERVPEGEVRLDLQIYDLDHPNELFIYIGEEQIPLEVLGEDDESLRTSVTFDSSLLQVGENTIELVANSDTSQFTSYFIVEQLKLVSAASPVQSSQNIWQEDFEDLANGTIIDQGTTSWSSDTSETSNSIFEVRDGAFYSSDTDGVAVWTSEAMDISALSGVNVSLDIWGEGNLDDYGGIADFLEVFYILNSQEVVFARRDGEFNEGNIENLITDELNGDTLQIGIRTKTTGDDEAYLWDNIAVNGQTSWIGTEPGGELATI